MAHRAIPMIAFPQIRAIYIYIIIYIFLCPLVQVCIVYVVKEVASYRGLSQLVGVAKLEILYYSIYLKYIPEVLQDPLKGKESGYQIITIIMLLCFMLDKASHNY